MLIPAIAQAGDRLVGMVKYIQHVKPSMYWWWRKACSFSLSAPTYISTMHHPYKSLPAFFSAIVSTPQSWVYEQCLTETTSTSHNLLITPYTPSQNHCMTCWCPWHLPPNAWSVWAAPISCSTSHLALWHHPVYSWCPTQPTLHTALPLLTNSWLHLRSESHSKLSFHTQTLLTHVL